jgi:myo-inositol 2-dehydrogenase/D-chiro-inositol 1-dehydrogenase
LNESKGLSSLDAIIISTPTPTHETLIQEASQFVPFVLTEKPVGETADNIAHLFHHCQTLGVTLCCSFQRRFDKAYVSMQQGVTNHGQFGRPIQAHVVFGDHPSPPPTHFLLHGGGNIYSDLLPHDLDYLRWCFPADDEISTVYATGSSSTEQLRLANVHDRATVIVIFKSGAVATFTLSRFSAYGYDQRCEIWGEGGMRLSVQSVHDHSSTVADNTGVHLSKLLPSFPQRFDAAFAAELDAFADTILLGKPWPITSKDCIAVQRVCDAAKASSGLNIPIHLENLSINASRN